MKNMHIILGGLLVMALLCSVGTVAARDENTPGAQGTVDPSDDIAPYSGPIGADSPLHGLKLAMEDLDETFTFNDPSVRLSFCLYCSSARSAVAVLLRSRSRRTSARRSCA